MPNSNARLAFIIRGAALILAQREPITFRLGENDTPLDVAWLLEKLSYKLEEPPARHFQTTPVEDTLEDFI